jgi:hypothetical protein
VTLWSEVDSDTTGEGHEAEEYRVAIDRADRSVAGGRRSSGCRSHGWRDGDVAGGGQGGPQDRLDGRARQHEPVHRLDEQRLRDVDGRWTAVEQGDVIYWPSDFPHGIRNRGDGTCRVVWMFPTDSYDEIEYSDD